MNVQLQNGGSDHCGLFAIAFATALVNGIQPAHCVFDQSEMRQHLVTSLEKGILPMFPRKKMKKSGLLVKNRYVITLYCSCRMPDNGRMLRLQRMVSFTMCDGIEKSNETEKLLMVLSDL